MPQKYGIPERATLLVLMLNGGEMANAVLRKDHGVDLSPAGRAKLNKAELLETTKVSNRLFHKITPAGKDWCEQMVADIETPPRSSGLVRILFDVLRLYVRNARERKVRLVDVLGPSEPPVEPVELEDLIRRVYQELSSRPQEWIRLARLRPELNGAGKEEVDQTLLRMVKTELVHLSPDSDRKGLTDADHAAAIRIGKEDKHLVLIEES
ncbi:hypothetical protein M8542_14845 [Amycolatopsis sp. OK19-0408]|uniref:Uncharacterized protein n=1 Tax=Amycolatopsis iheyensis TaxID=2945988 RepID=A0A9X2NBM8_9PSEU|nr:hypothetical protein [Amycolatopsis iheyensis]MCR6484097.1 hypothetical protein [Amycolatopsis iheyensis]